MKKAHNNGQKDRTIRKYKEITCLTVCIVFKICDFLLLTPSVFFSLIPSTDLKYGYYNFMASYVWSIVFFFAIYICSMSHLGDEKKNAKHKKKNVKCILHRIVCKNSPKHLEKRSFGNSENLQWFENWLTAQKIYWKLHTPTPPSPNPLAPASVVFYLPMPEPNSLEGPEFADIATLYRCMGKHITATTRQNDSCCDL